MAPSARIATGLALLGSVVAIAIAYRVGVSTGSREARRELAEAGPGAGPDTSTDAEAHRELEAEVKRLRRENEVLARRVANLERAAGGGHGLPETDGPTGKPAPDDTVPDDPDSIFRNPGVRTAPPATGELTREERTRYEAIVERVQTKIREERTRLDRLGEQIVEDRIRDGRYREAGTDAPGNAVPGEEVDVVLSRRRLVDGRWVVVEIERGEAPEYERGLGRIRELGLELTRDPRELLRGDR